MPPPSPASGRAFAARCARLIERLGLGSGADIRAIRPLAGGTSSDIAVVTLGGREVCVKFARPRLRLPAPWYAPLRRNATEYRWLQFAAAIVPGSTPTLLGRSESENGFAMAYHGAGEATLWKDELLAARVDDAKATAAGAALARLHAASRRFAADEAGSARRADFRLMRLDPYFATAAAKHPDLAGPLTETADALGCTATVMLHGDLAPKNLLFRGLRPMFLDAECAAPGDPCFDVGFCLNHLLLKTVHLPHRRAALAAAARRLWDAYRAGIDWEPADALEARMARLLPMLLLARIDGRSPVEYLVEPAREAVRGAAVAMIAAPPATLEGVLAGLRDRGAEPDGFA